MVQYNASFNISIVHSCMIIISFCETKKLKFELVPQVGIIPIKGNTECVMEYVLSKL